MIDCPNPDKLLKPGMFASARFESDMKNALVIPPTAVFQGPDCPFVYVRRQDRLFEKVPVTVENLGQGRMLVQEGLEEGETIIAEGGIYLSR